MADRRLKRSRAKPGTKTEIDRAMPTHRIRYEIILYWSKPDSAYIAEVPGLPGCAADGKTYHEALDNVLVIIQEWIETAKELGRPVPKPRGRLTYA